MLRMVYLLLGIFQVFHNMHFPNIGKFDKCNIKGTVFKVTIDFNSMIFK